MLKTKWTYFQRYSLETAEYELEISQKDENRLICVKISETGIEGARLLDRDFSLIATRIYRSYLHGIRAHRIIWVNCSETPGKRASSPEVVLDWDGERFVHPGSNIPLLRLSTRPRTIELLL